MHVSISAGPRRGTRRALIAVVLPLVAAAMALPSAAQAGQLGFNSSSGSLAFSGIGSENNNLALRVIGSNIVISDSVPLRPLTPGHPCQLVNGRDAFCPASIVNSVFVDSGLGNDTVEYRLPHPGHVLLGAGNDRMNAGKREAVGRTIQPVTYVSGSGYDEITYAGADRGVAVNVADGLASDGRPGIDRENVATGFDTIVGSPFDDSLLGGDLAEIMIGLGGNDFLAGGHGNDLFPTHGLDGADDYHGGPGRDMIDYFGRTQPVMVRLDNSATDGQSGERDLVRTNVENIRGGQAGDVLDSQGAHSRLDGSGGSDLLFGGSGPDTLIGGSGIDTLNSGDGNDAVDSRDGQLDTIDCGEGTDSLVRDGQERRFSRCERVTVGKLRLTPESTRAAAGETARLRLSWRHPKAWKQLRKIELRLTRDGLPVGAITVRAGGKRITADGAIRLVRRGSRIAARGKVVRARLAVRLDASVAGATLKAEVEATDRRGRRQLERNAGTIRVAE